MPAPICADRCRKVGASSPDPSSTGLLEGQVMIPFVTRISLPRYLLTLVGIVLIWSIATQAKLTPSSSVLLASLSAPIYETDFAFDTETNVGLGVFRQSGMFKVRGAYMGPTGQPASGVFDLTTSAATEIRGPRVAARSGG